MQDPSIQDNPLSKQCNTSTCYAVQLCSRTSYANNCTSCYAAPLIQSTCCLCTCCEAPAANSRQEPLLSDTPTKTIEPRREIYRNLGRISAQISDTNPRRLLN